MPRQPTRRHERLDKLLVDRGLVSTRSKAQALILAGRVRSAGQRLEKPGVRCPVDIALEVDPGKRYVGRGGHKLAGALETLRIEVTGQRTLDVGASTGGFTQVLLEAGASAVIALDVGRGQLDWSLRTDPRVSAVEGVNARYLESGRLPYAPSLAVIDVSFISLRLVLPPVAGCLEPEGEIVALVKPQFEVGRRQVGRGGIVRDAALHRDVLEGLVTFVHGQGWFVAGVCASPLRGTDGNREFFLQIKTAQAEIEPAALTLQIEHALESEEEVEA